MLEKIKVFVGGVLAIGLLGLVLMGIIMALVTHWKDVLMLGGFFGTMTMVYYLIDAFVNAPSVNKHLKHLKKEDK